MTARNSLAAEMTKEKNEQISKSLFVLKCMWAGKSEERIQGSTYSLLLVYFVIFGLVSQFSLNCTITSLASVKNNQNNLLLYLKANTLFPTCSSFIGR